jgi:hypothetical protein
MSARSSTSAQFSKLNRHFGQDCATLEQSIRELKAKSTGECSSTAKACSAPVNPCTDETRLAARAKEIRNITEQVQIYTHFLETERLCDLKFIFLPLFEILDISYFSKNSIKISIKNILFSR